MNSEITKRRPNQGRHGAGCKVCAHPDRDEIERDWTSWGNTNRIARDHGLTRDSLYRHAHAFSLFEKRKANLAKALERMVERAEDVEVTAASVVSAVQALSKINSEGKWVDRVERVNLNDLFGKMTATELERYARDGVLPEWFEQTVGATRVDGQEQER